METYCIKCKKKVEIQETTDSQFKNGTPIFKGKCPECKKDIFRIKSKTEKTKE